MIGSCIAAVCGQAETRTYEYKMLRNTSLLHDGLKHLYAKHVSAKEKTYSKTV